MHAVVAVLSILFNNGLVIWGLGWAGWSGPTALAIHWAENAIGTIFIALRIWLHRRLTHKRGHYRNHFGLQVSGNEAHAVESITDKSFLAEYLTNSIVFTLGHGVFVLAIFACIFKAAPDADTWHEKRRREPGRSPVAGGLVAWVHYELRAASASPLGRQNGGHIALSIWPPSTSGVLRACPIACKCRIVPLCHRCSFTLAAQSLNGALSLEYTPPVETVTLMSNPSFDHPILN
jgi:hypothetical protein